MKRNIIEIDQERCNGCALCIPNCPEGALQIIDGKARLVSDLFCDGLGACIGHCPHGAIEVIEREAEPYDEAKVMENIVKQGENTIKAHLKHLKEHGADDYYKDAIDYLDLKGIDISDIGSDEKIDVSENLACGCPGTMVREVERTESDFSGKRPSELRQWPVQLNLLPTQAPFFKDADLLIAADCTAYAYGDFHSLIRDKTIVIGCPKFDDIKAYEEKLTTIIKDNNINSVTVAIMEVPCCSGLLKAVKQAVVDSRKDINLYERIVTINGEVR